MRVRIRFAPNVLAAAPLVAAGRHLLRLREPTLIPRLSEGVLEPDAIDPRFVHDIGRLNRVSMLEWQVSDDTGVVLTAAPRMDGCDPPDWANVRADRPRLSRFALLRPDGDEWILESGISPWLMRLTDRGVEALAGGDAQVLGIAQVLGFLADGDEGWELWEFHDRAFVAQSRGGSPLGGTFRFAGERPPVEPGEPPLPEGPRVLLTAPETTTAPVDYFRLLTERRSVRSFAAGLDLSTLAQVLWFAAQSTSVHPRHTHDERSYTGVRKPVPSAGATHSIEIWVFATGITGLARGVWWYDSIHHELRWVSDLPADLTLTYGAPAMLMLASRHARVSWKYERIAHALTLKDAGVLLQTLHLTAQAVGAGSCILGSGPVDQVMAVLNLDSRAWVLVGEIVLGIPASTE